MTTEPTPRERIAAGIAKAGEERAQAALARQALEYRPEADEEMQRLAALPTLSPATRMQVGLHARAKAAFAKVASKQ